MTAISFTHEPCYSLSKIHRRWVGVCVCDCYDVCVCVCCLIWSQDFVSIPIVPRDCCSSEEERRRNHISVLWETSYLTAKQAAPHTQEDVNPFHPLSTYVWSLQTVGQMSPSLFSLRVHAPSHTLHSTPTRALSGRCWLQSEWTLDCSSTVNHGNSSEKKQSHGHIGSKSQPT